MKIETRKRCENYVLKIMKPEVFGWAKICLKEVFRGIAKNNPLIAMREVDGVETALLYEDASIDYKGLDTFQNLSLF